MRLDNYYANLASFPFFGAMQLSSFTFQLNQASGTAPQYQAFVYQWDPTNPRTTESALFGSSVLLRARGFRRS
jgi:hypothetical protein